MFDNISKFLIEEYSTDFSDWLLGTPIALKTVSPSELNVEPIRADSVILMSAPDILLHTEFQTAPIKNMPFRMADYYLRLQRKFPRQQIVQIVIYLKKTQSELVQQNEYKTPEMTHRFRVIRLWEQPVEKFLTTPGLLPYAVLSQAQDKEQILAQVVAQIEKLPPNRQQQNLTAAVEILAGLELTAETIEQLMRNQGMQESVIYQKILREGEQRGRTEGRTEAQQQEKAFVLRLLTKKVGNLIPPIQSQLDSLSIEQLEALGEALLDFTSLECERCAIAVMEWLKDNGIEGKILRLKTKRPSEMFIISKHYEMTESITENGTHYGVEIFGKVFDNLSTEGLSREDWIEDFNCISGQLLLDELTSL